MDTTWIIGVGPGLGIALVKKFHGAGSKVLCVARNLEKLDSMTKEISTESNPVHNYSADVGKHDPFKSVLHKMLDGHGVPDLVVYNVSILRPSSPSAVEYESFSNDFHTNIGGALTAYQAVISEYRDRGSGTFAITGGGLSLSPFHEFSSLGVGKAGLRNLAFSMNQENKDSDIRIFTVTINGAIEEGSHFSPQNIAEKYFEIYERGLPDEETEYVYE